MVGIQKKLFFLSTVIWIGAVICWIGCADIKRPVRSDVGLCDPAADAAIESRDWQLSLDLHRQLLAREPNNGQVLFHVGFIYGNLEDREKEIAYYERALACGYDKNDRLYFNLGMAYADLAGWEKARIAFEKAIALAPQDADNYFALGLVSHQTGQPKEALDALNAAIRLDPRHWEAQELLVRIYLDLGQWPQARRHLLRLEQLDAHHPVVESLWDTYRRRRLGDHTLFNEND